MEEGKIPFPPMLVINLAHRPDKWQMIQHDFYSRGWPELFRMEAVLGDPGWYGCTISHVNCLGTAKENKFPWVLIIEDDCLPTENSMQRFCELLPKLWETRDQWDIFMGATTNVKVESLLQTSPPLLRVKGATAHFYLVNDHAYDKFIYGLTQQPIVIDELYGLDPSVRMICTFPHIAVQRPCIGDTSNGVYVDYINLFQESEKVLHDYLQEKTNNLQ